MACREINSLIHWRSGFLFFFSSDRAELSQLESWWGQRKELPVSLPFRMIQLSWSTKVQHIFLLLLNSSSSFFSPLSQSTTTHQTSCSLGYNTCIFHYCYLVFQPADSQTVNLTFLHFHPRFHSSEVHNSHQLHTGKSLYFKWRAVHTCRLIHVVTNIHTHTCHNSAKKHAWKIW